MDFGFLTKISSVFKQDAVIPDDDFVDRLNHHITSTLLLSFMVLVSGKTYVGKPLQCAVPHYFTGAMEQYAENYCFVQNTYFVSNSEDLPSSHQERDAREITYYQWVPFILALQSLMFYIPCLFWRSYNWKSGIHVASVTTLVTAAQIADMDERKKKVAAVVAHLYEGLHAQRDHSRRWAALSILDRKRGNYLTMLYLFVKLLYVVNIIGQFFLTNAFLSSKIAPFYGFELINDLAKGEQWDTSGRFPRVTYCDFEMRVLGNIQRHTTQCVLMINMFNEKIYVFLWLWFLLVAVVTIISFITCVFQSFISSQRVTLVRQTLRMTRAAKKMRKQDVEDFTTDYLRKDGVLMIRLIASGTGPTVAYDVLEALWAQFQKSKSARRGHEDDDDSEKVTL